MAGGTRREEEGNRMDRRDFLKLTAAGAASGLAVSLLGSAAFAGPVAQVTAAQRFKVGDFIITALSDGSVDLAPELFGGVKEKEFHEALKAAYLKPGAYKGSVNAFIIDSGSKTYLVDAGTGAALGPTLGKLEANLTAAGFSPPDIATLLVTHLHPDHIGGSFKDGKPVFANAEFVVADADRAFWSNPANRSQADEAAKAFFDMATASLQAYGERVRIVADGAEAVPGITAVELPGHTPGHTGYRVASGGDTLLIWGDIVHAAPLQLPRPERTLSFDVNQPLAAKTRKALLKQVAADRTLVAGAHLPFPGIGYIEAAKNGGYRFVPATWQYL
jgi:glyoxylase-like metal-dependent hydrolase (beta-lactamase superfamily II)